MSLNISYSGGVFSAPQAKSVGTVTSTSGDFNFADVTLLLHGDGTSGSTTITDSSSSPKTITVNGNAQIDTAVKKFGTGSIEFDGTGDYLTAPDDAAWDLGSGDFTIESWVYPTASPAQPIIIGQWTSSYSWVLLLSNDGNRYLRALLYNGSFNDYVSTSALSLNSWNHCAFVREGNTVSLYLNGTSVYSTTFTGSISTSTSALSIGANSVGGSPFQGYLDDVRVTKGVARYTSNFTPPTAAFPNTATFFDLDLSTGNYFNHTLSANTLVSFSNPPASGTAAGFALALTNSNVPSTYDIANASYDSKSFSVGSQETFPSSLVFKPDGTKMFVVGYGIEEIFQYSLSTAWDVSTASYDSVSFDVSSQEPNPQGLFIKPDGTKFWITGNSDKVWQYSMSTAWNISTASYDNVNFSTAGTANLPVGVEFKSDGTKMYLMDIQGTQRVYQYSLSTAWNLSTTSYDNVSFSTSSQDTAPLDLTFNSDGTKMYMIGSTTDAIYQYGLSTAWDLSTASYDNVSFSVASQETTPRDVFFKPDGTKFYIVGDVNDTVYQYTSTSTSAATVTYPSSVKFPSGIAPTGPTTGETDVLVFYTDDGGTTYQGFKAGDAMLSYFLADVLVVAGGGGGAGRDIGGGGGAGGYKYNTAVTMETGQTYTVTVGSGGVGGIDTPGSIPGLKGSSSIFSGSGITTISATGGGGGRSYETISGEENGGSGGGGSGITYLTAGTGISGEGFAGGNGVVSSNSNYGGGGGGGASETGFSATNTKAGGDGSASSITGTSVYYAGGGGGAGHRTTGTGELGSGGAGGGGSASASSSNTDRSGTSNTGGGGGASKGLGLQGGNGGSGVVIIRTLSTATTTTGSPTITTYGSYNIYQFTGSGSITF